VERKALMEPEEFEKLLDEYTAALESCAGMDATPNETPEEIEAQKEMHGVELLARQKVLDAFKKLYDDFEAYQDAGWKE